MSANIFNGYCNSVCSHPSCWIYYRNVLKNQVNTSVNLERKPLSVVIPHQSILNVNLDVLSCAQNNSKTLIYQHQDKTNNTDIFDYLLSRKKSTTPRVPHVTPYINNTPFLKESINPSNCPAKLAQVNVHEIFDLEELQADWKRTFKSKDIYVWVPGQKTERNYPMRKESAKDPRIIKTPVMQLAPVLVDQASSERKKSSLSASSEKNKKNTNSSGKRSLKKIQKKKSEKLIMSTKGSESHKENILQKSLEPAVLPQKMLIHRITDRGLNRFEALTNNQIYVLDSTQSNNFDKFYFHQNKVSPTSARSSELNANILSNIKHPTQNSNPNFNLKTISIIDGRLATDNLDFRLGPQTLVKSLSAMSSRTDSSIHLLSTDQDSLCDSMMRNAPSNRSTLNDEDLLPGSNMIQTLKNSYKLEKKQDCETLTKLFLDNTEETQMNDPPLQSARSAPPNNSQTIPNPPPPSPEISSRRRPTSAGAHLDPVQSENETESRK